MRSRTILGTISLIAWLLTATACSGDYCLRCLDPSSARPPVEGCDNDLNGLETAMDAYEAEGFVCVIFEN